MQGSFVAGAAVIVADVAVGVASPRRYYGWCGCGVANRVADVPVISLCLCVRCHAQQAMLLVKLRCVQCSHRLVCSGCDVAGIVGGAAEKLSLRNC